MTGLGVWSIGHSNHEFSQFVHLLHEAEIATVADIRSQPFSRYRPHFNRQWLETNLPAAGLAYCWLGDSLGGRPPEAHLYDAAGRLRYDLVAHTERFQRGIEELVARARESRVAMMCSEENPARCHRRLLVTPALVQVGVAVVDIRGDGAVEANSMGQAPLFDET